MNIDLNDHEDDIKLMTEKIVDINSSSVRNSKVNLRRRKALLINENSATDVVCDRFGDHSDHIPTDDNVVPKFEPPRRRNSLEAALDDIRDNELVDSESPKFEGNDDLIDENTETQCFSCVRSCSAANLLSVIHIKDEDRSECHLLENLKEILKHESSHLSLLNAINKFRYILKQSKVSDEILTNIFYNIEDLNDAQKNLVVCLEKVIANWSDKEQFFTDIMDLYVLLHMRSMEYKTNIKIATKELNSLLNKNEKLHKAMHDVIYEGEHLLLEELLVKPTKWLCTSLESIESLIEAADSECNMKMVKETLEKMKDNSGNERKAAHNNNEKNIFLRSGMFVELLSNDKRKWRHMFLFSGMLVCAKQKLHTDGVTKVTNTAYNEKTDSSKIIEQKHIERLEVKWFIPLQNLTIHQSKMVDNTDKRKMEISNLKDKIRELKMQLISERAKISDFETQMSPCIKRSISHNFSFRKMLIKKDVERIHHQIMKSQSDLLLLSPIMSFMLSNLSEKPHNLLAFSVKDLELWKRDISESKKSPKIVDTSNNSLSSINSFLESYRTYSSIIEVANAPFQHNIDDDGISGVVVTKIESVDGLNPAYGYYLTIEVDSFNFNEVKARTKKRGNDKSLSWNETFDIDLDCSHTMNILLYQVKNFAHDKESLLGFFEFKLDMKDLNNKSITKTTSIFGEDSTQLQIKVTFKIKTKNDLMKRRPSMMKTSLFGISLNSVVSRERTICKPPIPNVPMIIQICLKKIEDDGIDEEGIYRISGSKSDISEFYKRLNKNVVNALKDIGGYDLHTTTGIVKLFLRELPEPLMMTDNYKVLLEISNIPDEEERNKQYSEIIQQLPEPNHSTVIYILKHFQRVCEHANKNQMVASNLGLIIGPTLMMPPCNSDQQNSKNFAVETMNSMYLSRIFTQIMNGICNNTIVLDPLLSE